jgi:uncharacterized membrane protein
MIKMLLIFGLLFAGFFMGIQALRTLNGKEAWVLTKIVGYSILCSLLTIAVLVSIVVVF